MMNTGANYSSGVSANEVKIMESVPEALQRHKETQTVSLFSVTMKKVESESGRFVLMYKFNFQHKMLKYFTGVVLQVYNYTCKILHLSFHDGRLYLQRVSPRS